MSAADTNGEVAEQRMLGATPGVPALGRGPVPSGHFSRHGYHHPAAGWGAARIAEKDLRPAPAGHADGHLTVPWATFFSKGVSVGFGRTHDRRCTVPLRDLLLSGRARPSAVVTHHRGLDDAPGSYQAFDQRADGVIKAVLRP